ncbi:hypothetical protein ABTE62_18920, partial [Acinetobacter baumannii]
SRADRRCRNVEQAGSLFKTLPIVLYWLPGRELVAMRAVLDYCSGGTERKVAAGTTVVTEGGTTGHLYVLMQGRLEVLKGEMVVATVTEPGAVL